MEKKRGGQKSISNDIKLGPNFSIGPTNWQSGTTHLKFPIGVNEKFGTVSNLEGPNPICTCRSIVCLMDAK